MSFKLPSRKKHDWLNSERSSGLRLAVIIGIYAGIIGIALLLGFGGWLVVENLFGLHDDTGTKNAAYLTTQGGDLYNKKSFSEAVTTYTEAISQDANFGPAYTGRGYAYYKQARYDEAMNDYEKAISLNSSDKQAFNGRGNVYVIRGLFQNALADFNKAIELDAAFPKPYDGRGNVYFYEGDYQKAIEEYSKAMEVDPNYATAYTNRGSLYLQQKNLPGALSDLSKSIALDATTEIPFNKRAYVYYMLNDYPKSINDYTKSLAITPNFDAYFMRGALYLNTKKYKEAIADFDGAIRLRPDYGEAYHNRAMAYSRSGNKNAAKLDLIKAIENGDEDAQEDLNKL